MKKMMMVLALMVLVGSNFFGNSLFNAMADESEDSRLSRCYKSITIEPGDSLWSIAKEYSTDMELSVNDYVKQLKQMNGLEEDTIHAGNHLTVVYLAAAR